ncbi:hypothetical protein L1765_07550 [Microaerobacter geothermalis]|uniref:magnesium transporter MgtE N-terminal domain-containing protein n=1 Tax=Microaerobacter geothermalis TaxID=674972 RepID=UPI001F2B97ED|nr:hypothetical protein [Microaerobacter geothermalis]MCF6093835.1 hypothetical protein [Microaerobacter geothermalis]
MESTEKGYNRLEWFFYIILLPLLFTILLTGILLSFLGYNVLNTALAWANQIPYVEKIIPDPKNSSESLDVQTPEARPEDLEQKITQLQEKVKETQQIQASLQNQLTEKNNEISRLKKEIDDLEKQLEEKQLSQEERLKKIKEVADIYAGMSSSKAAPIIEKLTIEEAVLVLESMNNEARSQILAKMDPKRAADISIMLKDTTISKDSEIAALQERIKQLSKELSEREKAGISENLLIDTYSRMPPANAALILTQLLKDDFNKAIFIFKKLDSGIRSQILSQMSPEDASVVTKSL